MLGAYPVCARGCWKAIPGIPDTSPEQDAIGAVGVAQSCMEALSEPAGDRCGPVSDAASQSKWRHMVCQGSFDKQTVLHREGFKTSADKLGLK